jgi:hypothetical protein
LTLPIQLGSIRWAAAYPVGTNADLPIAPLDAMCEVCGDQEKRKACFAVVERLALSSIKRRAGCPQTAAEAVKKDEPDSSEDPISVEIVRFYAGYLSTRPFELHKEVSNAIAPGTPASDLRLLGPNERDACSSGYDRLVIFGVTFCTTEDVRKRILTNWLAIEGKSSSFLAAVPHAFGAFPIRASGDTISHTSHGMLGTLIIEPEKSEYTARGEITEVGDVSTGTIKVVWADPTRASPALDFFGVRSPALITRPALAKLGLGESVLQEHVLAYQDGLNLWSRYWAGGRHVNLPGEGNLAPRRSAVPWGYTLPAGGFPSPKEKRPDNGWLGHPLPDCLVCDDSYDLGKKGVSYRSAMFTRRLGNWFPRNGISPLGLSGYPDLTDEHDLNRFVFPPMFFAHQAKQRRVPTPRLGLEMQADSMIRVVHPAGRARQRAFVTLGAGYQDLFPGFGSAHSALLAPGKSINAGFCAPRISGDYLWRDGPQHIFASGVWGHLAVSGKAGAAEECK